MKPKTPYADLLPPASSDELLALKDRIATEGGIHDCVLLSEAGEVLDGHTRLGIDKNAPTKVIEGSGEWSEAQKKAFVIRVNLGRRNLSPNQRDEVTGTCKKIAAELKAEGETQAAIAKMMGVSREAVKKWLIPKVVRHNGTGTNTSNPTEGKPEKKPIDCRAKIPPQAKPQILEEHESGKSAEAIAADLKVTRRQVDRVIKSEKAAVEKKNERKKAAAKIKGDFGIHHGDFRKSGKIVADASVDLIFTDPPYDEEAVQLYSDLAVFAARVLRPGGWCLAYCGQSFLPQILASMSESLTYGWTFAIRHTGGDLRFRKFKLRNGWKPIVGFYKPKLDVYWDWLPDITSGGKEKAEHEWQQAVAEAEHFVGGLTVDGALVCDPFCGGGTTILACKNLKRKWVAFDVDAEAIATTRVRVNGST